MKSRRRRLGRSRIPTRRSKAGSDESFESGLRTHRVAPSMRCRGAPSPVRAKRGAMCEPFSSFAPGGVIPAGARARRVSRKGDTPWDTKRAVRDICCAGGVLPRRCRDFGKDDVAVVPRSGHPMTPTFCGGRSPDAPARSWTCPSSASGVAASLPRRRCRC